MFLEKLSLFLVLMCFVLALSHTGLTQDFEYELDDVISEDYTDWNTTIREIITLFPGYNCSDDPKWPYGEEQIFTCDILPPSSKVPDSVHRLRPGDINVIGAIGDSLSAASGGGACSMPQMLYQYRGKVFSHGGDETYATVPTLANILRKYNPGLKGFGKDTGGWMTENAAMNLAVPGAVSLDIPLQAERLVEKMQNDVTIDYEKDWKLITIFIGGNDLCAVCRNKTKYSPEAYIDNIRTTIQTLHEKMPRTLVNVVGILDLREINKLQGAPCRAAHLLFCDCVANYTDEVLKTEWEPILIQYQDMLEEMVMSGVFDDRDDFTVVHQPFFHETKIPTVLGVADRSYMAPDCFHFSAKGHAETGNALWNNMVQPVGSKERAWTPNGPLTCPTQESPYLYTNINSRQNPSTKLPMTSKVVMTTVKPSPTDDGDAEGGVANLRGCHITAALFVSLSAILNYLQA
ncbi:phospholipase B1, membrane-associated-like [Asterias rubens]|uniref:phospholipase B1, membrane-associated-like n=1 Tax=Asterias rubens TaxID=7604 RepID=UPI0014559215|nr:phospholipase B1, membrane-associated-like [Asterias rubens]